MQPTSTYEGRTTSEAQPTRRIRLATWFAFALSATLIVAAARGDLWLDEIWSLFFVRASRSVADLFVRFRHDNNHVLNSLYLYWLGERETLFVYRLLAVFSGIGSVFLVGYVGRRIWGRGEALCATILAGTSYPLLLYFSEARGYAPAIFFALLSYVALRQTAKGLRPGPVVLFWAASILGLLSHLTFVMMAMSFVVVSVVREIHAGGSIREKTQGVVVQHGPPIAFFAWWYFFYVRGMVIGGGPVYDKWEVVSRASVMLLGLPQLPGLTVLGLVGVVCLVAAGAYGLAKERDRDWVFFPALLLFSPALLLVATNPKVLYFRYFIVCFPFFYLLLSHLICRWYRSSPARWRWLAVAAVAVIVAGQARRVHPLLDVGRGSYAAALTSIAETSTGGVVRVGSDHDVRNRMLFDFYAPRIGAKGKLAYVQKKDWLNIAASRSEPPDWIITHSQDLSFKPPEGLDVANVGSFPLVAEHRFSGVSGWSWFLFRRERPR